jgi:hypothetical protein
MTGGKLALLISGVVLALFGFGAAVGGGGLLWAQSERTDDGYLTSPTYKLETDGSALTAEEIHLGGPTPGDWVPWFARFEVRIDVEAVDGAPVFAGFAPRRDVDGYLDGVAHAEVARLGVRSDDVTYRSSAGSVVPEPPAGQGFWVASTEGPGAQRLTWQAEPGTWALVVMNADASPGIAVQASAATPGGFLLPVGIALLIGGLVLLGIAVALVLVAVVGSGAPRPVAGPALPPGTRGTSPVTLAARLDGPLSRWLWLVKWVLLIPHAIVLVFLWMAFVVLTIVAGFAILSTGRYPRGIFDFNVGVIRWTWRAMYYGYSALGTDRYPPFTLEAVDYPATFDVAYPERLSRGLVLVKWWLLAIPHYIIVALLVGGGLTWRVNSETWGTWTVGGGGGIIGLLVFVVGLLLLFTARYPQGLFDVVMGLNRWVYRVLAYVALMTDEYPPFRLDLGGEEPAPAPEPPSGPSPEGAEAELVNR